jgi:hypothetical protein
MVIEQVVTDPLVIALLANLEQRGFVPERQDASRVELLRDAPGQAYRLGDGWLHLHVYVDAQAAQTAAVSIPNAAALNIDWVAPPHFFQCDRLIVLYLGVDERVIGALSELCAPPFYSPEIRPPAATAQPAANFGFTFEYGICYQEILDTFEQTFRRDVGSDPSITVPVTLSDDQKRAAYGKLVEINFLSYPPQFNVPTPASGLISQVMPEYRYYLTVRNADITHRVAWENNTGDTTYPKARRLGELFALIIGIVKAQPAVQNLPAPQIGCA